MCVDLFLNDNLKNDLLEQTFVIWINHKIHKKSTIKDVAVWNKIMGKRWKLFSI